MMAGCKNPVAIEDEAVKEIDRQRPAFDEGRRDGLQFDRRRLLIAGSFLTASATVPALAFAATQPPAVETFLDAVSDTLIPGSAVEKPGRFLAGMLPTGLFDLEAQHIALVSNELGRSAGKDFLVASPAGRSAAMQAMDDAVFSGIAPVPLEAAWKTLKRALINTYYTSETGASKDLVYELVPGRWEPDVPLTEQPRAYSTDSLARRF